jgi:hypothetical protein
MSEQTQEQAAPTKEELIKFFQEQIDVKKVQLELHDINAKIASARAEELRALAFIAQMTNPQQNATPHVVTQEDLDENPELVEQGFNVGDEVMVAQEPQKEEKKSRKLKTN